MEFPSAQLLVLLQTIRGKHSWDAETLSAALDVLKYILENFAGQPHSIGDVPHDFNPEEALTQILDEEKKGVGAAVWVSLGLWLAKMIIERLVKK